MHTATRSPAPLAFFDLDRRLMAASRSFERIVGIEGRDYLGKRLDEVIPDLAPELIDLHRRTAAGENLLHDEEVYVDSHGEQRWMSCEYRPVPDPSGEDAFLGYFVHGHDVTPMIKARREAQSNSDRLRMAMDAARAGAFEVDYKGRSFWCSPEFVQIVGREMVFDDVLAAWPMVVPDDLERLHAVAQESMRTHQPGRVEVRIAPTPGEERWIEMSVEPQFDAQGELERTVGFVIDIDARKRQELALNEARRQAQANAERLRLALGAARAGVCELDLVAKTIWYSPEWIELVGAEASFREFALNPWPMAHPDDRPAIDRVLAEWTEPRHEPFDFRVVLPTGETRWVQGLGEQQVNEEGKRTKIVGLLLDIDARKRQELALLETRQELQANGERLKLAMDAAQAGAFETNMKDGTFWCSPEFVEIVGRQMTFEEAMGVWPMSHPEDVPKVQAQIDNVHTGETSSNLEWRLVMPNGEHRWIDGRSIVHLDENGVPEKVAGLVLDIDARKRQELSLEQAREAVQANVERLKLALDVARGGVFETDFENRTYWASPELCQMIGKTLTFEEATSGSLPMCHPDDAEWVSREIVEALASDRAEHSLECRIMRPDGETRWLDWRTLVHRREDGTVSKVIGLALDIDARKRQELALTELRRVAQINADRLGLAMSAAKAGVCEIDFAAKSMWCSPEFVEILGREYAYEDFVGTPWPMCHPDDRGQIDKMRESWGSGRHEPVEFRIVLPDGEPRWVQVHGERMMGEDGQLIRTVGLLLDIDARKRQELALVEAERAAQAAADAKSEFLANMSHEIRTPMNGVLGVLHLLASENLSEEGRKLLDEAGNCGRMLSQLLDDVIDFSRVEAGRLELSPEPVNPSQVLESVVGLLRPNAQAKGLALRVQIDGKADDAWILADPVRIRQALFNLIGNAVKFTTQGHVEARLAMSGRGKRRRLRVEIEDTGVGIPEAAQASLFARFQQADGSTSRKFGGSGLGLAITRRLAEMMGGGVGFASKEGEGSTFWFEIVADRAEAPSIDLDPAELDLTGLKILLVEDNPTNRLVAGKMLEAMGMSVATAEHGGLGVEAAKAEPYDLILMDVQMPVMDGLEATRRIRALDTPAARTPILGLTANAMAHQKAAYMAAGMNGVVAKPISPAALVAEMARAMSEHQRDLDVAAA